MHQHTVQNRKHRNHIWNWLEGTDLSFMTARVDRRSCCLGRPKCCRSWSVTGILYSRTEVYQCPTRLNKSIHGCNLMHSSSSNTVYKGNARYSYSHSVVAERMDQKAENGRQTTMSKTTAIDCRHTSSCLPSKYDVLLDWHCQLENRSNMTIFVWCCEECGQINHWLWTSHVHQPELNSHLEKWFASGVSPIDVIWIFAANRVTGFLLYTLNHQVSQEHA